MKYHRVLPTLLFCAGAASAQGYPEKPVRVVVPFPAGGAADIVARQVVQGLGASASSAPSAVKLVSL